MNDAELDQVYTQLCRTMTTLGEAQATLYLARLALLALHRLGDAPTALALVDSAAQGLLLSASPSSARS